jgi:3-oxoacyl-[acyl-carrier-protein] synthase-3
MNKITAAITAVGAYVPEFVLSNQVLESMVETNDEWITTRTGIKERRLLKEKGKGTSFMAIKAAQDLIAKSKINPEEIDLVIMATAKLLVQVSYTECQMLRLILSRADIKKYF